MSSAIYHKHHADGLITACIHRTTSNKIIKKELAEEELDAKVEHHSFWQDRKHEREELS